MPVEMDFGPKFRRKVDKPSVVLADVTETNVTQLPSQDSGTIGDSKTDGVSLVRKRSIAKPFEFTIDKEGWMVSPSGKRLHRTRFAADW